MASRRYRIQLSTIGVGVVLAFAEFKHVAVRAPPVPHPRKRHRNTGPCKPLSPRGLGGGWWRNCLAHRMGHRGLWLSVARCLCWLNPARKGAGHRTDKERRASVLVPSQVTHICTHLHLHATLRMLDAAVAVLSSSLETLKAEQAHVRIGHEESSRIRCRGCA